MNFKDSNLCWEKPKRKLRAKRRDEVVSGHWGMTMSHSFNSLICLLEAFAFCCLYSNKRKRFPLYHCEKSVTCVPLFSYLFIYLLFIHRKKEKVPERIYALQIAAFWLCFTAFLAV